MQLTRPLVAAVTILAVALGAGLVVGSTRAGGGEQARPDDPTRWTVRPAPLPAGRTVANPGKGWLVYGDATDYTGPAGSPLREVADLADVAYSRWNWSRFYADADDKSTLDFTVVDTFFSSWLAADPDKELAIAVMAENTDECTLAASVTPGWVFSEGAASVLTDLSDGGGRGPCRTPVWSDPTFLGEYTGFLVQLRDHLATTTTGLPAGETWLSRVQFVGANSYGNFGEGQTFGLDPASCGTGARYESLDGGGRVCVVSEATFEAHMRMFLSVFTPSATPVVVPWGSATLDDDGAYDWTVSQGMGLRRDGIFGPAASTRGRFGEDLARAYGLTPTVFERYDTASGSDPTRAELERALRIGHPSFFGLGFADQAGPFWQREEALVRDHQRRLGYDFRPGGVSFPRQVVAGESFRPRVAWVNGGVDYTYEPMVEGFALLDDDGTAVATSFPQTGANPLRWTPGRTTVETPEVRFDGVAAGSYRLAVGLFSREDRTRSYRLATTEATTPAGWLPLHEVQVSARSTPEPGSEPVVVETELQEAATISAVAPGVVARTHVRLRDPDLSSGMGDRFNAEDPGDAIAYQVDLPADATWAVSVGTLAGPHGGTYQLAVDGVEVGSAQDTWATKTSVQEAEVGTTRLDAGTHTILLTATGPGPASDGDAFVIDRITFTPDG